MYCSLCALCPCQHNHCHLLTRQICAGARRKDHVMHFVLHLLVPRIYDVMISNGVVVPSCAAPSVKTQISYACFVQTCKALLLEWLPKRKGTNITFSVRRLSGGLRMFSARGAGVKVCFWPRNPKNTDFGREIP